MSVVSQAFVDKWKFNVSEGTKVKLTGFNNASSTSKYYISLTLHDYNQNYAFKGNFLVVASLAIDVIIGFDILKKFKIISEEKWMILETDYNVLMFKRNRPDCLVQIQNNFIPPGHSLLNINVVNPKQKQFLLTLPNQEIFWKTQVRW